MCEPWIIHRIVALFIQFLNGVLTFIMPGPLRLSELALGGRVLSDVILSLTELDVAEALSKGPQTIQQLAVTVGTEFLEWSPEQPRHGTIIPHRNRILEMDFLGAWHFIRGSVLYRDVSRRSCNDLSRNGVGLVHIPSRTAETILAQTSIKLEILSTTRFAPCLVVRG